MQWLTVCISLLSTNHSNHSLPKRDWFVEWTWVREECVLIFVSDWPLVVASNISVILHSPWGQNSLHCTQLCPLLYWTVAKCSSLVWQSLQSTDSKRGCLKSRSHRAAGRNSILRPMTFLNIGPSVLQRAGPPSGSSQQEKNRNEHTDFEASECTQGRREVTIDWREVESRKKNKKAPEKSKTQPCTVLPSAPRAAVILNSKVKLK